MVGHPAGVQIFTWWWKHIPPTPTPEWLGIRIWTLSSSDFVQPNGWPVEVACVTVHADPLKTPPHTLSWPPTPLAKAGQPRTPEGPQREGRVAILGTSPCVNVCVCVCVCVCTQSCPTLCNPLDCSPARFLCPWNFPGKNTGVGCHFLLQRILLIQRSNPCLLCLLHYRQILYHWSI